VTLHERAAGGDSRREGQPPVFVLDRSRAQPGALSVDLAWFDRERAHGSTLRSKLCATVRPPNVRPPSPGRAPLCRPCCPPLSLTYTPPTIPGNAPCPTARISTSRPSCPFRRPWPWPPPWWSPSRWSSPRVCRYSPTRMASTSDRRRSG
jgi:hypothetical protein